MIKKVLLATKADMDKVKFPCYGSPKLDGIRCCTPKCEPKTRTMKDVPNHYVRTVFGKAAAKSIINLDGELVTYTDGVMDEFNTIQSKVMSHDKVFKFELLVFDSFHTPNMEFNKRLDQAEVQCTVDRSGILKFVPHIILENMDQLVEFEQSCVDRGYEGIMLRDPKGIYKQGRSTVNQGILLKVKRFEDIECTVIGYKEMYDKHQRLIPNMLGAFVVTCKEFGTFDVGSGFTAQQRSVYWQDREQLVSSRPLITVKYQPFGMVAKPRFPTFKGFRSKLDI